MIRSTSFFGETAAFGGRLDGAGRIGYFPAGVRAIKVQEQPQRGVSSGSASAERTERSIFALGNDGRVLLLEERSDGLLEENRVFTPKEALSKREHSSAIFPTPVTSAQILSRVVWSGQLDGTICWRDRATWDVVKILEPKHLKEVVDIVGDADSVFSIGRDGFVKKFCGESGGCEWEQRLTNKELRVCCMWVTPSICAVRECIDKFLGVYLTVCSHIGG